MTSRPPPRTIKTRSKPSVNTSKNSMSVVVVEYFGEKGQGRKKRKKEKKEKRFKR